MAILKVIIPIFNSEKYIRRCIDSVLNQTEQSFEIVLIDDGSTDGSASICDNYVARDSRIHVIHQKNQGISSARNAGLDYKIESDYIIFIDSDDWIPSYCFKKMINAIELTNCEMVVGMHIKTDSYFIREEDELNKVKIVTPEECYCAKNISSSPVWGKLYKSHLFETLRFPEGRIYEEFATTWKIIFSLCKVAIIYDTVYYYYINEGGIMHSIWNPQKMDFFKALDEKINFFHSNGYYCAESKARYKKIRMAEKFIAQIGKDKEFDGYVRILGTIKDSDRGASYDVTYDGDNNENWV